MSDDPHDDNVILDAADLARAELDRYVDRAVACLRAPRRRRAVIREELSAHLHEIFAQERQRGAGDDVRPALDATFRRFGDCDLLAQQLQASVPALQQILYLLFNRERHMWRLMIGGGVLVMLFGTSILLPALGKIKHLGNVSYNGQPLMTLVVGVMVAMVIVMVGLHLLAWGIARRVRKPA